MAIEQFVNKEMVVSSLVGTTLGAVIIASIFFAFLLLAAFYIYFSYSWMTIARKLKYRNSWLAWIPVANVAMMLQLGGFHWAWIFLILIPFAGWVALFVLVVISTWRIFEKRDYPGWFSLSMIIPKLGGILYLIAIGFVAFKDKGNMAQKTREVKAKGNVRVRKKVRRR